MADRRGRGHVAAVLRMACVAAASGTLWGCDVETTARDAIIALFYDTAPKPQPSDTVSVAPRVETQPVLDGSDAADDVAIWVNADDPRNSWIVGTNKRRGVEVYDLDGQRRWRLDAGRINNVDVRGDVVIDGTATVVVGATNRTTDTVDVWSLDTETGRLMNLLAVPIAADLDDPYGFCLYRSPRDGALYAFATDKSGGAAQWRLAEAGGGRLRGDRVRTIHTDTQPEACVADDVNGVVYIGEEGVGIWRLDAEPTAPPDAKRLVASVRPEAEALAPTSASRHHLTADVEGLALYAPPAGAGYLVASSQGNSTYVVFDRSPPHAYRGTFRVVASDLIDGATQTDGIDIVSAALGPRFPEGLFVAQDGDNVDADGADAKQNFKYVSWADIRNALNLQ